MNNSVFHETNTGAPKPAPQAIDPRATQYGFVPLWNITGLPTNAFKLSVLPGSRVIPLRPFPYGLTDEDNRIYTKERTPAEQVLDLQAVAGDKFAVTFPELAKLNDEVLAKSIVEALTNPEDCTKYPFELGNTCGTCWLEYLRGPAPDVLATRFGSDKKIFRAAAETLKTLVESLDNALAVAREAVGEAIRAVDNPKEGKDRFYDVDYINLFNTHQDRPETRTTVNAQASNDNLAKAIMTLAGNRTQGLTMEDVEAVVSTQLEASQARIAELEAKLAEKEETANVPKNKK